MGEHHRIYPRKSRKPEETYANKKRKRQKRAHRRINKGRVKAAVRKWDEWRELKKILDNPNQPALTDYLPRDDEKPEKDKDRRMSDNGV